MSNLELMQDGARVGLGLSSEIVETVESPPCFGVVLHSFFLGLN